MKPEMISLCSMGSDEESPCAIKAHTPIQKTRQETPREEEIGTQLTGHTIFGHELSPMSRGGEVLVCHLHTTARRKTAQEREKQADTEGQRQTENQVEKSVLFVVVPGLLLHRCGGTKQNDI